MLKNRALLRLLQRIIQASRYSAQAPPATSAQSAQPPDDNQRVLLELLKAELDRRRATDASNQRLQTRTFWLGVLGLIVTTITMAAVIYYTYVTAMQLEETQTIARIATRQLAVTDRPWLSAKVVITQPFKVVGDSISVIFVVDIKNVGKSVATHIESYARLYPQPFTDKIFAEPMRHHTELCDKARRDGNSKSRLALFPDEEARLPMSAGMNRADALKGSIVPVLVGCVGYRYATSTTQHQTRFIYKIRRYEPDDPSHPRLIDFTKIEALPLSRLRLEKYLPPQQNLWGVFGSGKAPRV